jgi:hypothetical protein
VKRNNLKTYWKEKLDFFEEEFIKTDDAELLNELKEHAEALGFDSDKIAEALITNNSEKSQRVRASIPFIIQPQKQRREARKRLNEEAKRTANVLLNRLELTHGGRELAYKYVPGLTGTNYVAAVQLVNREVSKILGIKSGELGRLKSEDYKRGIDSMEEVLNTLYKRVLAKKGGAPR